MAVYQPAKVNTQWIGYSALVSQANTKIFQQSPTLATGDFKTSLDGGTSGNLGTLPTNTPGAAYIKFTLATTETNGANATVMCVDASGAEWCDLVFNIPTVTRQLEDLAYPATSGRSMVVDASGLVDANMVKAGASGSGNTITTSGGVTLPAATIASTANITTVGAVSGNVSGNVVGSVGSVSGSVAGSVASVTGSVGGSVGSVGSGGITTSSFGAGTTIPRCTLVDTLTTYTGNTVQTGDSFARIGAAGVNLTNISLPSAGLANVTTWTVALNGNITGNLSGSVGSVTGLTASNLDATISSRMATYTQPTGFLATTFGATVGTSTLTQAQVTGGAYTIQSSSCVLGDARIANLDAAVSTRSTLTAANVWDLATSGHTTTGTFGAAAVAAGDPWATQLPGSYLAGSAGRLLAAAGTAADPWLTLLPGSYTSGMAGYLIGNTLPAIKVKTDLITAGSITVQTPVDASVPSVTLIRGDSYFAADGRAITFTSSSWPDVTGATVVMKVNGLYDYTFTVTNATTVTRDFTSAETNAYPNPGGSYDFQLIATLSNGRVVTLAEGLKSDQAGLIILPNIPSA